MKTIISALMIFLIASCTSIKPIDVVSKPLSCPEPPTYILASKIKPVKLADVKFHVVNENNLDDFIYEVEQTQGDIVWIAVTVNGYENLALNLQELRRYIKEQKAVIIYYENLLKKPIDKPSE